MTLRGTWTAMWLEGIGGIGGWERDRDCPLPVWKLLPELCTFYMTTKLSSDGIPDACCNFGRCRRHVNTKFGYLKSSYLHPPACASWADVPQYDFSNWDSHPWVKKDLKIFFITLFCN